MGIVLATQNPVDLDYKALSNTGTWFLGKLQTERDKNRVLDGLEGVTGGFDRATLDKTLSALRSRVFLMHNVHDAGARGVRDAVDAVLPSRSDGPRRDQARARGPAPATHLPAPGGRCGTRGRRAVASTPAPMAPPARRPGSRCLPASVREFYLAGHRDGHAS